MESPPEKQEGKRSLEELKERASLILNLPKETKLRQDFVEFARKYSPSSAYKKALGLSNQYFVIETALEHAEACRFLAVIKRDYGSDVLEEVVG